MKAAVRCARHNSFPLLRCSCLITSLILCLSGCVPQSTNVPPIQDDLGRTIQLGGTPHKVVSLAPSVTELIYASGAGDKLVGVTTVDNYPPDVQTLSRFSALPVDFEAILALDPDLVLASDQINSPNDAATLAEVGIPVFFVSVSQLDDVTRAIRRLGTLLGSESYADQSADSLTQSIDSLRVLTRQTTHRPRTLFLISDLTLYTFGHGSYMHEVIEIAGGLSIAADLTTRAPVLTDEFVLAQQPDVIVGTFGADFEPKHLLIRHPTWDVLNAVVSEQVYAVNADLFLRPGPRLIDGTWQLARTLHPELLP